MSLRSCLTFRTKTVTEDSARKPPIVIWSNYAKVTQQSDNLFALDTSNGPLFTNDAQVLPYTNIMFEFFVENISVKSSDTSGAIFSFEQAVLKDREDVKVIIHPYQGQYFAVNNIAPTKQISLSGRHHILISVKQNLSSGSIKYFVGSEEKHGSSYVFVFVDGKLIYTDISQAPIGSSLVMTSEIEEPVRYFLGFSAPSVQTTKTVTGTKGKVSSFPIKSGANSSKGSTALFREFRYHYDTSHDPLTVKDSAFTPPTLAQLQSENICRTGDIVKIQSLIDLSERIKTCEEKSRPLFSVDYPTLTKDTKINKDSFAIIATAINSLEEEFSNNCCEANHCQYCQSVGYKCQTQCKQCNNCHQCKDCTKIAWVYEEDA